jgi:hypothetical protein
MEFFGGVMYRRIIAVVGLFIATLALNGCGQGAGDAAGLNGGITVSASATGSFITATATYTNPTKTNLIGLPITFGYVVGGTSFTIGTFNTNNSGTVSVSFTPAPFNGTQAFLVTASTGNLQNFASVNVAGRNLALTPPVVAPVFTNVSSTLSVDIPVPVQSVFATYTDPFTNNLSGLQLTITNALFNTLSGNTLDVPSTSITTDVLGKAPFPGATAHMIVPSRGSTNTMAITWTVTDTGGTGLTASGLTTINLSH